MYVYRASMTQIAQRIVTQRTAYRAAGTASRACLTQNVPELPQSATPLVTLVSYAKMGATARAAAATSPFIVAIKI